MDNALSLRQRQIVAATFKLMRDKKDFEAKQYDENLTTVGLMQGRLREQVGTLIARMQNRLRGEDEFQKIVEDLMAAIEEMKPAEEQLEREEPAGSAAARAARAGSPAARRGPLPRRAGRLPAAAACRASSSRWPRTSPTSSSSSSTSCTTSTRRSSAASARRRSRRSTRRCSGSRSWRAARSRRTSGQRKLPAQMGMSGAAGQNQRQLIEQTEELARKLERLARERSRPDLAQTARRLQQAADSMRRASANRSSGEIAQGTEALEQLREARRLLERNKEFADVVRDGRPQPSRRAGAAHAGAHHPGSGRARVAGREGSAGSGGEQTRGGGRSAEAEEKITKLLGEKDQLEKEVGALESQIDRVARQARGAEKDAARSLSEAAESIRENQVKEKIRYSKGVVRGRSPEYAKKFEEEIGRDLEEMAESLGEAKRSLGGSQEDKAEQALQGARDLVRRLESFENGLEDRGAQRQAEKHGSLGRAG